MTPEPDMTGTCPGCDSQVDYVRFGEDFPCPVCLIELRPTHDCEWDSETQDGDCYDYLVAVAD